MNRFGAGVAIAAVLGAMAVPERVSAAPPTVTPSPGYDARLQEQRKANAATSAVAPVAPSAHSQRKRHPQRPVTH
jgi:hypothetical protein